MEQLHSTDASGNSNPLDYTNTLWNAPDRKNVANKAIETVSNSTQTPQPIKLPDGVISTQTTTNGVAKTTISMWVYLPETALFRGLFSIQNTNINNTPTAYVPVLFLKGDTLRAMFWDNDPNFTTLSSANSPDQSLKKLQLNTWYHIALTGGPGGQNLYINGVLVDQRNKPITHLNMTTTNMGYIYIGQNSRWLAPDAPPTNADLRYFYKGRIDNVRIYKKELSADEVRSLYSE